ncbi:hypothetical protein DIPPA_21743 [Diplonema papillatum]|nr:hypothetical protein DIPPA_21743 [Diplonema papillatum]
MNHASGEDFCIPDCEDRLPEWSPSFTTGRVLANSCDPAPGSPKYLTETKVTKILKARRRASRTGSS